MRVDRMAVDKVNAAQPSIYALLVLRVYVYENSTIGSHEYGDS